MGGQSWNARALLGFMGEQEALNFLRSMCILDVKTDDEVKEIWRKAKAAVEVSSPVDFSAEVLGIDKEFAGQLDVVSKDPLFPEAIQQRKSSFKLVEIDKIVCFQQYIITDYSKELAKEYDLSDVGRLIDFCLPSKRAKRPIAVVSAPQEFTILSSSQDLRVLGPSQMQDPVTKRTVFGFGVGWGSPFIQVVKFKGLYFLRNGYHRVYEIRRGAVTHVPCILIEGESFADTGAMKPGFFGEQLLTSDRPPIFADFLSDKIAPPLHMKPFTKVVRVRAEESVLPVILPSASLIVEQKMVGKVQAVVEPKIDNYEEFNVVKEDWNIYRLEDGTVLRVRQLLVKIAKQPMTDPEEPNMSIETSNLLTAIFPPSNLRGPPSAQQYGPQELSQSIVLPNMKYVPTQEVTNEYMTKSGIKLLFQIASLNVARTNKFGPSGEPVYLVNAQTNVQILPSTPSE
jgi:hypothetical protein